MITVIDHAIVFLYEVLDIMITVIDHAIVFLCDVLDIMITVIDHENKWLLKCCIYIWM